jgi:hypothetical protein
MPTSASIPSTNFVGHALRVDKGREKAAPSLEVARAALDILDRRLAELRRHPVVPECCRSIAGRLVTNTAAGISLVGAGNAVFLAMCHRIVAPFGGARVVRLKDWMLQLTSTSVGHCFFADSFALFLPSFWLPTKERDEHRIPRIVGL